MSLCPERYLQYLPDNLMLQDEKSYLPEYVAVYSSDVQ